MHIKKNKYKKHTEAPLLVMLHADSHNVHTVSAACFLMGQDSLKQRCSIWRYNDCGSAIPVTQDKQQDDESCCNLRERG